MVDLLWLTVLAASLPTGANHDASTPVATASVGSSVVADATGLWIAERNAQALVRADRDGVPQSSLPFGNRLGQLVAVGEHGVFVADGAGDRIVRVDSAQAPTVTASAAIAEPYGLSLSPDGNTLLATSVADHALVAFDATSLAEQWRVELTAEPRPVAIDATGSHAAVGFLSMGSVATIDLESPEHPVRWSSLEPRVQLRVEEDEWGDGMFTFSVHPNRFTVPTETGRRYARSAFAMTFVPGGQLVTAHHLAMPQLRRTPGSQSFNSYGGAQSIPPVRYRLAVHSDPTSPIGRRRGLELGVHQPRALAYDAQSDTLYVGGFGDDMVQAIADASAPSAHVEWGKSVSKKSSCGVDGITFDDGAVFVHCALTRNVIRLDGELHPEDAGLFVGAVHDGPELAASVRSEQVERGARLFRKGNDWRLSGDGSLACSTCHPTGRPDGLSWRLGDSILQTPMLSGRVASTAPYKWDGQDPTLKDSIRHTIGRIGGSPENVPRRDIEALAAYVESLEAPRGRADVEADAVRRGEALFAGAELQCADCHSGPQLADGGQYPLAGPLAATDTPSLIGLGHTAPYYHDGSALTLADLVADRGSVHDMADMSELDASQQRDLVAYLSSL